MPTFCAVYVQSPAYKVVATNGTDVDIEDIVQTVVVYPLAEKFNTYALRCPGSRKNPDGTLFVPATGNRKSNYTIAYSQNQKVAAFASDAKMARLALKDCERFYLNEKKKDNEDNHSRKAIRGKRDCPYRRGNGKRGRLLHR
jgi:hypothetical protein